METGKILESQLTASLVTLENSMADCPEAEWNQSHGDAPFSQVVFHTLFYCDFYLSESESGFRNQPFHKDNLAFFGDYEEQEDKLPVRLYDRESLVRYLDYCKKKVKIVLDALSQDQLGEAAVMRRSIFSRMELFIYLTRHIQHHAAQLGLRVQLLTGKEMKWVSKG